MHPSEMKRRGGDEEEWGEGGSHDTEEMREEDKR